MVGHEKIKTSWFIYVYNTDSTWPVCERKVDGINRNILTKLHADKIENVAFTKSKKFSLIWPGDLVFDPNWPIYEQIQEIINTNTDYDPWW